MVPITGLVGVAGCALITTFVVAVELHVPSFTMNVYVPAANPLTVVVVPEPVAVPLGVPVIVHVPLEGKPLKATLPVATEHVGCVTVPTIGVVGTPTTELIIAFVLAADEHVPLLTVKVYVVPAANPVMLPVVPVPVAVAPPGVAVTVHVPLDGKPLKATLPVDTVQLG